MLPQHSARKTSNATFCYGKMLYGFVFSNKLRTFIAAMLHLQLYRETSTKLRHYILSFIQHGIHEKQLFHVICNLKFS